MNKAVCAFFAMLLLSVVSFSSCSVKKDTLESNEKIKIMCTIFPEYDWVKQITKGVEGVEVSLLIKNGVDLHNYNPSAADLVEVSSSDLLVYVGGESDEWIEDLLQQDSCQNLKTVNLVEELGEDIREEEVIEGMQAEEEEEEGEEEIEYDEHVWLSLRNAQKLCNSIAARLCEIDEKNSVAYLKNTVEYNIELSELDEQYSSMFKDANTKTLVFCDRFPFRYMTEDYNLSYHAAFVGCSAETEASFETVAFLTNKINELKCKSVFTIDGSDNKIAKTVINNSDVKNCKIAQIDSLQSTTKNDIKSGKTYLSAMKNNLATIKNAIY